MIKYYSLLFTVLLFFGCSDDEPNAGCFQDEGRKIVSTVNNINGIIRLNEDCGYLIDPDDQLNQNPTGVLFPCNLDMDLRLDESRVIFSGFIYESFETEDICADFFEIVEIEIIPNNQ